MVMLMVMLMVMEIALFLPTFGTEDYITNLRWFSPQRVWPEGYSLIILTLLVLNPWNKHNSDAPIRKNQEKMEFSV